MRSIVGITCAFLSLVAALPSALAEEAVPKDRPVGLERRIPLTTSRVVGSPEPPPPYKPEKIYPNLTIKQPLTFEAEPGTSDYLVIQHLGFWSAPGKILRVKGDRSTDKAEEILSFPGIAYGLDFHKNYQENGYIFVGQNLKDRGTTKSRVSRFTVDRKAPFHIDPKSELVIIEWESDGHNGADVAFGEDGYLFITSGDGTSDSDTNLRGQDLTHLTCKVLRIDVDHAEAPKTYAIPKDNPFLNIPGARPETWAYGLRNPWRLSYDKATNQLWVGQNGQDLWESAVLVAKGANYGWSRYEGSHPFYLERTPGPTPVSPPTVEHHHSEARSLTGGLVYHGDKLPGLEGAYVYGDYSTGKIWGVKHDGKKVVWHKEIADTPFQLTGFSLTREGELVVIDHKTAFHKLVPTPAAASPSKFPRKLSETGLFASLKDRKPAPGLIPYSVNSPLWSDGAHKERYIAVPDDLKVEFSSGGNGWVFPDRSVLVKTFLLETERGVEATKKPVETRIMTRHDNEWVGYSYLWNDDLSDATLVAKEGVDKEFTIRDASSKTGVTKQTWHYPSRAECMVCHSRAANWVLGLSGIEMNKDHDYGGVVANQLRTLDHIGLFSNKLDKAPEELDKLANPADEKAGLEPRVRAYLHSNCASCHIEAGGGNASIQLAAGTPLEAMRIIDLPPLHEVPGTKGLKIVAPGDPDRSILLQSISHRGTGPMPPLATAIVDQAAVKLITDWIKQVKSLPKK